MPKGPFLPTEFTPSMFSTAADKAEFGNHFVRFIESEWTQALFTKDFYHRLSMCFGNIAHCDRGTSTRLGSPPIRTACASLRRRSNGRAGAIPSTHSPMSSAPFSRKFASATIWPVTSWCCRSGAGERDGDAQTPGGQVSCSRQSNGRYRRDNHWFSYR